MGFRWLIWNNAKQAASLHLGRVYGIGDVRTISADKWLEWHRAECPDAPLCLADEHLMTGRKGSPGWYGVSEADIIDSVRQQAALARYLAHKSGRPVGIYHQIPYAVRSVVVPGAAEYNETLAAEYHGKLALLDPLAATVDWIGPDLYMLAGESLRAWHRRAWFILNLCRDRWPTKWLWPYLMPDAYTAGGYRPLTADEWAAMLQLVQNQADGAVLYLLPAAGAGGKPDYVAPAVRGDDVRWQLAVAAAAPRTIDPLAIPGRPSPQQQRMKGSVNE